MLKYAYFEPSHHKRLGQSDDRTCLRAPDFCGLRPVHLARFETCDSPSGMRATQRYAEQVIAVTKCSMKFCIASLFILRRLSLIPTSTAMSR